MIFKKIEKNNYRNNQYINMHPNMQATIRVTGSTCSKLPNGKYYLCFAMPSEICVGQINTDDSVTGLRVSFFDCDDCDDCDYDLNVESLMACSGEVVSMYISDDSDEKSDDDSDDESNDEIISYLLDMMKLEYNTHWNCETCKSRRVCGCGCDDDHDGWDEPDNWITL